ncbi:uncharacterized protein LOC132560790 [Ylistrum balloti]|uniref:uncharacterized protein LOC132560790 n=1 Tax=Ylistrum balloti TaxID=509963 RepID=UPI002905E1F1|nr:uncharacterized protein LOC132560790 [Ylistrum balloti]
MAEESYLAANGVSFPTMKMDTMFSGQEGDMYCIHGHAGNISRRAILNSLKKITDQRLECQQPISIADFGTADGRASLSLVNEMIDIIQTDLRKEQAVIIYYNDQPMSDFNLLSKVIHGNEESAGLSINNSIYPVMIPRTMYEQCLPDNSLDLAISSVATHYLSKKVCHIKNGICMGTADDTEQGLMREQGIEDWRNFVISRGRELKPGGFLITMNISSNDIGETCLPIDKGVPHFASFWSDMKKEGLITQDEYIATNFNSHYMRTPADFAEPFSSDIPEVMGLGLELVSLRSVKHYLQKPVFQIGNKDDNEKLEYSRETVAMIYPWMHHVLYGGLSKKRTEEEKERIIDKFFSRLQMYAFEHSAHKPYLIFTEVIVKKCQRHDVK